VNNALEDLIYDLVKWRNDIGSDTPKLEKNEGSLKGVAMGTVSRSHRGSILPLGIKLGDFQRASPIPPCHGGSAPQYTPCHGGSAPRYTPCHGGNAPRYTP
ncbi:hypothetical protein HAX54_006672, partial [Datura stramonium]|nr:hypothetical protein [Datura stramonium]